MPTASLNALCSFIKKKCKKTKNGRRISPLKAFRQLAVELPELQSQDNAMIAVANMPAEELIEGLKPAEKAFIEQNADNAIHMAYFCFLAHCRKTLMAWMIRNETSL